MRFPLPSIKCSAAPLSFRLLPSAGHSDNEAALCSSRKLGEPAEHLMDGSKIAFVGRRLNFGIRVLFKSAVNVKPCSLRETHTKKGHILI